MPIYEFACDDCQRAFEFEMSISNAGSVLSCPKCEQDMRRVYYAPALMNRIKARPFSSKPKEHWNANDSKLAALRLYESKGPDHMREAMRSFGPTAKQVLAYKKKEYGS